MRLIKVARKGLGGLIAIPGFILWIGAGLIVFIWTLYVLFSIFGILAIFVGLLFAPITYLASIFIVWFSTGVFPVILLIPYVASFVGITLMVIGGVISGED